jgi:histidinol dehydrogenase
MAIHLDSAEPDFAARFAALLANKREIAEDVDEAVRAIVDDVRRRGDEAVIAYTEKFDRLSLTADRLKVSAAEIAVAGEALSAEQREALVLARDRIESHHRRQLPTDDRYKDALGVELGSRWTALEAVGIYVPGGTAAYPSSVLMNAIPAKVAGVDRIVMVTPTPEGKTNPLVFAAASLAGVDEIYRIGGAQAIAALAYGTNSIPSVVKIIGPGNAYVAAAKRQVFGQVGIDMVAGPSEVLIVADRNNDPAWVAADLLAQAEHDVAAQAILVTDDREFGNAVEAAVEKQLETLDRADTAAASWRDYGAIIRVRNFAEAPPLINRLAPEHLELAIDDAEAFLAKVRNAGAIFIGRHTPEAIGDYVAGSNHVLPTARSARFSSGLSVLDFMKRTSILTLEAQSLRALGPAAITLAEAEGFDAHARSVAIRLNT